MSDFACLFHLYRCQHKCNRLPANCLSVIAPRRRYFRVSGEYGNYGIFPALDKLRYQRFDLCGKSFVRCTDRIGSRKKPSQLSAKSTCSFRRVAFANAESVSARRFVLGNVTGRALLPRDNEHINCGRHTDCNRFFWSVVVAHCA
jgi:hypothetical protein